VTGLPPVQDCCCDDFSNEVSRTSGEDAYLLPGEAEVTAGKNNARKQKMNAVAARTIYKAAVMLVFLVLNNMRILLPEV
jgi:hypothetical protein